MKILQIVPALALVYGGPSQMVRGLSAALARQGCEVTAIATHANGDAGQPPLDVPLQVPIDSDGYQIVYFRCAPFRRYKFSLDLLRWLGQHAREYDIAHIHALFSPISSAAARVARYRGLPYLLRPLGTLDPADLQKKRALKQLYARLLEKHNLAGAAGMHFTSAQEAAISERFGAQTQDFVIPIGVEPQTTELSREAARAQLQAKLGLPPDIPLLLFLSRVEPKKGLDLLLPALEKCPVPFHFTLAGANPQDPQYEATVRSRIRNSSLGDRTTLTGFVTGDLKTALLRGADLFILPSAYENFGIAVVEAMAAGTAVLISKGVYIWQEVLAAEAGWVVPRETDALARSLVEILRNREECWRRGDRGRQCVEENFRWDPIARQTLQIYQKLLQEKHATASPSQKR